jgi:hypothetical protein
MRRMQLPVYLLSCLLVLAPGPGISFAQGAPASPPATQAPATPQAPAAPPAAPTAAPALSPPPAPAPIPVETTLNLSASFSNLTDNSTIAYGLHWRVFDASNPAAPIRTANDPAPSFKLAPGDYIVHVSFGLASSNRRISLTAQPARIDSPQPPRNEKLSLSAGGLSVHGTNGGAAIDPRDLQISVFIPSPTNDEDKLLTSSLIEGQILLLPEGTYHIVTVYGASNSTVAADIGVQTGKVTDTTINHKAARVTLKLVSHAGSEALANTAWTVLTPGGDVIREELGAFPTMILAEGNYTVIARNDGKSFTDEVRVTGTRDQDIEVLRRDTVGRPAPQAK